MSTTPTKTQALTTTKAPQETASLLKGAVMTYTAFNSDVRVELTLEVVKQTLTKPTKSGKQPSDNDCVRFMLLCKARELNPFEGDAYLVGYDSTNGPEFSLITAHQALLKRAEANPEFGGLESGVIIKDKQGKLHENIGDFFTADQTVVGGWANVHRKNLAIPFRSRLRIEARRKNTHIWGNDASGMITKCAEADALRMAFPTKLGGLYLREEMQMRQVNELPKPQADGLETSPTPPAIGAGAPVTMEAEAEVVPEGEQQQEQEQTMHWSFWLKDDAYRLAKMPETSRFAGMTINEVSKDMDRFAAAHAELRRDSEDAGEVEARMALDAAIYHMVVKSITKAKLTIEAVEAKLIEAGAIEPGTHLTDLDGEDLLPMKNTIREVFQKKPE